MLTLKNLSLTAADAQGRADIVKNVSLDVEDGKFLVITGPNGGGKTTPANIFLRNLIALSFSSFMIHCARYPATQAVEQISPSWYFSSNLKSQIGL